MKKSRRSRWPRVSDSNNPTVLSLRWGKPRSRSSWGRVGDGAVLGTRNLSCCETSRWSCPGGNWVYESVTQENGSWGWRRGSDLHRHSD